MVDNKVGGKIQMHIHKSIAHNYILGINIIIHSSFVFLMKINVIVHL
jgi:hypothetical protein